MNPTFDISALNDRLKPLEALVEFRSYPSIWKISYSVLLLTLVIPFLLLPLFAFGILNGAGGLVFVVMLLGLGFKGLYDLYREINEAVFIRRFAQSNDLQFIKDSAHPDYPGSPFRLNTHVPFAVRSKSSQFYELGYLRPTFSKRRSNSSKTYTYLRLKLPYTLPHIIMRKQRGGSILPWQISDVSKFHLEGEFGTTFDTLVTRGHEQDALYIFTPDVMERFINVAKEFECEIVNDEFYLYTTKKIMIINPRNLEAYSQVIGHILAKFAPQSTKYAAHNATPVQTHSNLDHVM